MEFEIFTMPRACKFFFALSALFGSLTLLLFTAGDYPITEPLEFTDTPPVLTGWGVFAVGSGILAITMIVTATRLWTGERRKISHQNYIIGNNEPGKPQTAPQITSRTI